MTWTVPDPSGRRIDPDADAEGLLLTLTRLEDYARSVGLERQPTDAGTPFDANGHEAM